MKTKLFTLLIVTIMLTNCTTTRKSLTSKKEINSDIERIIYYASLAGSTHNTQPWLVDILSDTLLLVRADFTRKLHVVDPSARGIYISLGAFIENLCIASEYYGYLSSVYLTANSSKDNLVAEVCLKAQKRIPHNISKLESRTTLRIPFKTDGIIEEHINIITGGNTENLHYFPANSLVGQFISKTTIEAYTQQANREDAKEELANWIRFSNKDVKTKRDGLTTSGMGIKGVGGFMVSRFFNPNDSKKKTFVDTGVNKTVSQAQGCGGWLVITQPGNTPEDWMNSGRLYQRSHLECKDLMIGFHPMNQMIEEPNFEGIVNETLGLNQPIHLVARIGYVDTYPQAVSVRREIYSFIRDLRK